MIDSEQSILQLLPLAVSVPRLTNILTSLDSGEMRVLSIHNDRLSPFSSIIGPDDLRPGG
jgi:hypothetical protein